MSNQFLYAPERDITNFSECIFYHAMELPGYGFFSAQWDLRDGVDAYLGNVKFTGKRVLEIGTASGFLCFEMEKRGADVVAYDLSEKEMWDIVPFGGRIAEEKVQSSRETIRKLNNGWWLAHKALKSKAKVVYGSVYDIPVEIGPVHISTFGSILLHLRDPFLALQRASLITTETIIVTDLVWPPEIDGSPSTNDIPDISFYPDPDHDLPGQAETWWHISPSLISRFVKILGFRNVKVTYHQQKYQGSNQPTRLYKLYTVVGKRS